MKCKHCGEFLDESKRPVPVYPPAIPPRNPLPWYFRTTWIIVVALSIPPFALPMVLMNPSYGRTSKIVGTIGVLVLTWLLWVSLAKTWEAYQSLQATLEGMSI